MSLARRIVCASLIACLALPAGAGPFPSSIAAQSFADPPAPTLMQELLDLTGPPVVLAACCKVCRKGKACGDSCIKASYTCHKGPGCACDG